MQPDNSGITRAAGTVAIEQLDPNASPKDHATASLQRYVWRPSSDIARNLPQDFSISFDCHIDHDGVRRFAPTEGIKTFIAQAALGGEVLLNRDHEMTPEQRHSYRAMRLIHRLAPYFREHFGRTFYQEQDLYLPAAARLDGAHVLPEYLGVDSHGRGQAWTPPELIKSGREEARRTGASNPDVATCIRFGLLEAARLNPLILECPDDGLKIVRLGLFDLGPTLGRLQEAQIEQVQYRLLSTLEKHLEDDTDTFNRWFFENLANVVHAIAKKKDPGGTLPRELVRQALLETVFRAYSYVGQCVDRLMLDFLRCLPEPLKPSERALFHPLYLGQPFLGGLPIVLLHDRLGFLREILLDLFEKPHDKKVMGVLLRLLQYYGDMVNKKRQGDRDYKRTKHHRNDENRPATSVPLHDDAAPAAYADAVLFQDIAEHLRDLRQLTCQCNTWVQWHTEFVEAKSTSTLVVIQDGCGQCGYTVEYRVSTDEIQAIRKSWHESEDCDD